MSLLFTSSKTVPPSGMVSIAAVVCEQPTPANTITLVDYSDTYYSNVSTRAQLSTDAYPPISNIGPYDTQLDISDKVIYSDVPDRETVILGYEYQLKFDHYDTSHPSGTVKVTYLGGDPIPQDLYRLEASTNIDMWEDYRDRGSSMTKRYDNSLSWGPLPTGVTTYRLRLLLSEDICFTGQTLCVTYTKVHPHNSNITNTSHVSIGWREIINPRKLYKYGSDYSLSFSPDKVPLSGNLSGKEVWLRRSKLANIRCEMSSATGREGWYLKVWGGSFTDDSGNVYGIDVDQASAVKFNNVGTLVSPRCGLMVQDDVGLIDNMTIHLSESPLHYWDEGYPMYIPYEAYDAVYNDSIDPTASEAYSHGILLIVNGNRVSNTIIKDIDEWNGIIYLNTPIEASSRIKATYYYEQRYYTLQIPDMCPQIHHEPHSNDGIVVVLIPNGNIAWYYKSDNPDDIYDGSKDGWSTISSMSSIVLVAGTIKIAEMSIVRNNPEATVSIYDSRTRGGGLFPDYYYPISRRDGRDRLEVQEESIHYADIGMYDGVGLKKDGVIIVKVPMASILSIRDAIVEYSKEEIKRLAGIMKSYNPEKSDYEVMEEATKDYREQYAYTEAIRTVRNVAESNAAAGVKVVLVDENMNVI